MMLPVIKLSYRFLKPRLVEYTRFTHVFTDPSMGGSLFGALQTYRDFYTYATVTILS